MTVFEVDASFLYKLSADNEIDKTIANEITNNLNLDEYERQLGFSPKYVSISEALCMNNKMLNDKIMPRWTKRDTLVLELLNKKINKLK